MPQHCHLPLSSSFSWVKTRHEACWDCSQTPLLFLHCLQSQHNERVDWPPIQWHTWEGRGQMPQCWAWGGWARPHVHPIYPPPLIWSGSTALAYPSLEGRAGVVHLPRSLSEFTSESSPGWAHNASSYHQGGASQHCKACQDTWRSELIQVCSAAVCGGAAASAGTDTHIPPIAPAPISLLQVPGTVQHFHYFTWTHWKRKILQ